MINAKTINRCYDGIKALQRYYFSDIQKYIEQLITYRGDYSSKNKYEKYDVCLYDNGSAYLCISDNHQVGILPTEQGYFVPTNRASKGWFRRNYDPMFDFKEGGKITKYQFPAGPIPAPKLTVDPNFGLRNSPTEIATYGYTSKYSPTRFNYMTGQTEENPHYKSYLETPTLKTPSTLNASEKSTTQTKTEDFASQVGEKPGID
jgi:hypothetical protein